MAHIVVVHGVGQQLQGEHTLHTRLFPALADGLNRIGVRVAPDDVVVAYYGHLFRPEAEVLATEPYLDAFDIRDAYDQRLLEEWWRRAGTIDQTVIPTEEETLARSPFWVQRALFALNRSRFFSGLAERALIGDLRQVSDYMKNSVLRARVRDEVSRFVEADTKVFVAHSLGSVVAYEALCAHAEWEVRSLVTLGSPLGMRHLIYDRLEPPPQQGDSGLKAVWPTALTKWTNIADAGDVVAVVEDLRPLFGDEIQQIRVHNGARAHDMRPYLTDAATGGAIAAGLDG
jgi:hypothetical protein